ncbi:MAG TPA: superoxide dismutase, partial [Fibrobacteria bacterium]|nr:superoxide dismutase [Fibrobacteria bacterium]
MAFTLPPLPYPADGLEPHYDKATLEIHHGKHHKAYVDKLNAAIEGIPALADKTVEELLMDPEALPPGARKAILNNGGGHANHTLFWNTMAPGKGGEPKGKIGKAIEKDFGSFADFKKKFSTMALEVFGSGWTFLFQDKDGKLQIGNFANQETPINKREKPLLLVDVWEHAYYLKWQNRRTEWVETWWKLIDWDAVEALLVEEPAWYIEH